MKFKCCNNFYKLDNQGRIDGLIIAGSTVSIDNEKEIDRLKRANCIQPIIESACIEQNEIAILPKAWRKRR